jgi:hypothetical protein
MKFVFSEQIFEKVPNVKFNQNRSSRIRAVTCGQTDGHDKTNTPFRNFVNAPDESEVFIVENK